MKRNVLLVLILLISLLLALNSSKKILTFRTTSQKVAEAEQRLEQVQKENEALKKELEHKKSEEFAEGEIRDKLGLVKEGEAIVVLPKEQESGPLTENNGSDQSNWEKWWKVFFGS